MEHVIANYACGIPETHGGSFRVTEIARPEPSPGQVRSSIAASGVNCQYQDSASTAAHARHLRDPWDRSAGTVEALGAGVDGFRRGGEVYGMTGGVGVIGVISPNSPRSTPDCSPACRPTCRCAGGLPHNSPSPPGKGSSDRPRSPPARRFWFRAAVAGSAMSRSIARALGGDYARPAPRKL